MAENNFEKLLGKNGELAKERKKQVLTGALEIVQHYCEETPNKMRIIAAMFGKKLGEEFFVKHPKQTEPFLAQFEDNGVWYICSYDGRAEWHYSETLLVQLLTGEAVIIND